MHSIMDNRPSSGEEKKKKMTEKDEKDEGSLNAWDFM